LRLRLLAIAVLAALGSLAGVARADGGPIMPLTDVHAGMSCTGNTVVLGTTISQFDVQVLGVVQQTGEGDRILVQVSGPAVEPSGIAEGFSGSPVYCKAGDGTTENIGAISEGVGQYGNNVGLVTPIQQMLGESVSPPSSAPRLRAKTRQLVGPLTVSGLSPSLFSVLQTAAKRAGRQVVSAPAGPDLGFPVQQLVPGASVATSYSSGTVATGAIGTVTYRDGPNVYVFGHELDGAGRRSLMLQDAYVYGVIDNPDPALEPSYKLASPGHTLGTVTDDTPNAVVGTVGAGPNEIPLVVTAHDLDTGHSITERTQVADETAVGFPLGTSLLDMIAPLAVGQAGIDVFNGAPAAESGSMCLTVDLREHATRLHFCNRYVGIGAAGDIGFAPPEVANGAASDVGAAMSTLDEVLFAQLHVTHVAASIKAQRGLAAAVILGAHGPRRVTPGQLVTVHVQIQLYRRSVKREIALRVRIPRKAGAGKLAATIHGPPTSGLTSSGGAGGLTIEITDLLTGGGGSGGSGPRSLAAVRKAFARIANYDGLLVKVGHSKPKPAYRDPKLLLTGRARLQFDVKR
jgi:hypothetical protein